MTTQCLEKNFSFIFFGVKVTIYCFKVNKNTLIYRVYVSSTKLFYQKNYSRQDEIVEGLYPSINGTLKIIFVGGKEILRSYFRLKAHFIFNCHFIKWPCISKSGNIWSWLHFIPNGTGCQMFFTLYLEGFQMSDLG